ncbi:uncharacterized protein FFB14_09725 [Fusarium fujikuroi]|nr:uncharacterized protein FFB14_09725 [Fusarium fujikuroi]
MPLKIYSKLFN